MQEWWEWFSFYSENQTPPEFQRLEVMLSQLIYLQTDGKKNPSDFIIDERKFISRDQQEQLENEKLINYFLSRQNQQAKNNE